MSGSGGLTRRRFLETAVSGSAALALAGCARPSRSGRVVEFWTISLRPTFTAYILGRVAAFEADHPGVTVRWVDVPFEAIERKLLAAAAAGRAPDVVNLSDMMFARFAAAGAFADVGALVPGDPAGRYHAGALDVGRLGGALLALPWYLTTQALIVNRGLLAEGGDATGTLAGDWRGLMAQANPYQRETGSTLFTQPIGTDSQLPMMLLAEGLAPFRVADGGELRADLTRSGIVEYLRAWAELYREGALPREAATRGFEHLIDVYQNERVALVNTGANFLGRVRDVSRRVYDATEVFPPVTGALGRAHIAVMPVCVSARARDPGLAAEWAWFLTSPESQLEFCRLAPILPSTPGSLDDPFFRGPTSAESEAGDALIGRARATVARTLSSAVAFTPAIEAWPAMRRDFNEGIKASLLGDAPIEQTLAGIESRWDERLVEMNARRAASGAAPATPDAIPAPARTNLAREAAS
ncbi:MAG: extracellular solute-binding protein [Phycisphaerales bacterium]